MEYKNDVNSVLQSTQYSDINFNNVNNINNFNGTTGTSYDRFPNATKNLDICKNDNATDEFTNVSIAIYRYKFTNEFMNELFKFSKIHQYDHRKDFKEAWDKWMDENDDIIDEEVRRLTTLGYEGDIIDKMFKSARYYFRKKSTEKKDPVKRRVYVGTHKDLLEAMDDHINKNMNSGNFKPSDGFDEFCKENIDLLKEQINALCKAGFTDSNEIKFKIKKTYKNRYFLAITK
jgi:hypothetical protein